VLIVAVTVSNEISPSETGGVISTMGLETGVLTHPEANRAIIKKHNLNNLLNIVSPINQ
jgi:hypothetical protein